MSTKTRQRLTAFSPNECSRCAPWLEDRDASAFGAVYDPPSPERIVGVAWPWFIYAAIVVVTVMCARIW